MRTRPCRTWQPRGVGLLVMVVAIALPMICVGCKQESQEATQPAVTPPEPRGMPARVEEPTAGEIPSEYALLENPFPLDEKSRAGGEAVYDRYCVGCHGSAGKGDGPKAASLAHKPAVLSSPRVAKEMTDAHLFWRISEGMEDMPAWKDRLSDQEVWNLVNHIRAYAAPGGEPTREREPREGRERVGRERGGGPRGAEGAPGAREGRPREGGPRMREGEGGPRPGEGGPAAREGGPREGRRPRDADAQTQ